MRLSALRAGYADAASLSDSRLFACSILISVGFAPPELPVYVQPPCPAAQPDVDARLLGLLR